MLLHQICKNQAKSIDEFIEILKGLQEFEFVNTLFCMEYIGFYCNNLLNILLKNGAYIVQENPIQIKKSMGIVRGKNDKDDACRIALYA